MVVGGTLILIMILVALLAPWISIHDPFAMDLPHRLESPSLSHPFGLDQNGGDLFAKVVYGARISLLVSMVVVLTGVLLGLIIGSLAGYLGGAIDMAIMRIIDMFYAFPGFLLALAMVAVLGPSIKNLVLAMTITSWTGFARLIRGEILHLKTRDYVVGAQAIGARPTRIVVRHIWPNLVGPVVVQATFSMAGTIISESGLSFLGLGAPPTTPSWGALLNAGRGVLIEAPHLSIFPGVAILILVLGFNLFGDGLRDLLDQPPPEQKCSKK